MINKINATLTDAIPRSGAERNERVRMPAGALFRQESFRLEGVRLGVDARIAMHSVDEQCHGNAGR